MTTFYGVAIGEDIYPTPTGQFRIMEKEKNPTWEPPKWLEKKAIPPGPDNPLGLRALNLGFPGAYRIHGTNDIRKVGRQSSNGCIGLFNEHILEVYDRVQVGTPVLLI